MNCPEPLCVKPIVTVAVVWGWSRANSISAPTLSNRVMQALKRAQHMQTHDLLRHWQGEA